MDWLIKRKDKVFSAYRVIGMLFLDEGIPDQIRNVNELSEERFTFRIQAEVREYKSFKLLLTKQ